MSEALENVEPRNQRSNSLSLAFSPRSGRKAAGADSGQVASVTARCGAYFDSLAERFATGRLPAGFAAGGNERAGRKDSRDVIRGPEGFRAAPVAGQQIGERQPGQGGADLPPRGDGQGCGDRERSDFGWAGGPVRDLESRSVPEGERGGRSFAARSL